MSPEEAVAWNAHVYDCDCHQALIEAQAERDEACGILQGLLDELITEREWPNTHALVAAFLKRVDA